MGLPAGLRSLARAGEQGAQDQGSILGVAGIGAVALGMIVVGVFLYVGIPGLDARLARRDWDSPRAMMSALVAVLVLGNLFGLPAVLFLDVGSPVSPPAGRPLPASALVIAMLGTQLALMAVLVWRVVRPGALTWEAMGLTTDGLGRRLGQGLGGGFGILVLAAIAGWVLRSLGVEQTQAEMFAAVRNVPLAQFVAIWLTASIIAPICEECFFRGYVFSGLRGRYGRPVAYVGSALLFAVIHFNLPALAPILLMALGLAFLYDRSGSVVPGIVAHGLNNSLALTALYTGAVPT